MARYEFMKGLPVITMAEGRQVGKVDDLVVDPDRKAVRWIRLHRGGLLGGERLWVSVDAVHGLGEEALTINAETDVLASADATEAGDLLKTKRQVIGSKVITIGEDTIVVSTAAVMGREEKADVEKQATT